MTMKKWLNKHTHSLFGRWVAVTGATGGIGQELCRYLAMLDASLILMDRNMEKSFALRERLQAEFPNLPIKHIPLDLSDFASVRVAAEQLKAIRVDVLIHNAGAYSIPRRICDTGLDNVFQINFAAPYYLTKELLPQLAKREGSRVVVVGSIAHNYSKLDPMDIDFSTRTAASKAYGNAKRFLMFSMYELFQSEKRVALSVVHPGITFTGITAHYPKLIFAIIKHPMKFLFMKPAKATLSIVKGLFDSCDYHEWIGPAYFDVWGWPKKRRLQTCSKDESKQIAHIAETLYKTIDST